MKFLNCLLSASLLLSLPLAAGTTSQGLLEANVCLGTEATVAVISPSGRCTGTVIRDDVVMTAAHCVDGHKASEIAISFDTNVTQTFEVMWAHKKTVHEDYVDSSSYVYTPTFTEVNDIALLFFVSPLGVLPAELPKGELWTDAKVRQEGYGIDESGRGGIKKCRDNTVHRVGHSTLITTHACGGDSGGPIYRGNVVYGVTSFSWYPTGAANSCEHDAVYVSTFHQKNWILSQLGENPVAELPFGCGGL